MKKIENENYIIILDDYEINIIYKRNYERNVRINLHTNILQLCKNDNLCFDLDVLTEMVLIGDDYD